MPTAATGQINLCLENLSNRGMQPLLVNASPSATQSLTTQPVTSSKVGARLLVQVFNAPSAGNGTFTLTGKDLSGNAVTEGPITVPAPDPAAQNAVVGRFEYLTTHVFASIDTNGVATSNMSATGATMTIQAIQAGKKRTPGVLKVNKKLDKFSPQEHRGSLDRHFKRSQLRNVTTIESFEQVLYPDNSLWFPYMMVGSDPTITTLPSSPTSLKTSTAVSGSPLSLTTQPTAPGMHLILVVDSSSVAGSIALTGADQYGNAATETIDCDGDGTFYSENCYSAIASGGVVITGLTDANLTITGVFGWKRVWLPGDVIYSSAFEAFTGVDSYAAPYSMFEEGTLEFGMDKEAKLSAKGIAQDRTLIGARTDTSLSTNRIEATDQPEEVPGVGWASLIYLDSGVTPTTLFADLVEGKITLKSPLEAKWTATNSQVYNRVNRGQREYMIDAKYDHVNVLQQEKHRKNQKQYLTHQFIGKHIGGGNNELWQFQFPLTYDDFDIDSTPDKMSVEANVTATAQYDALLGGSMKLTVVNQVPPDFTS